MLYSTSGTQAAAPRSSSSSHPQQLRLTYGSQRLGPRQSRSRQVCVHARPGFDQIFGGSSGWRDASQFQKRVDDYSAAGLDSLTKRRLSRDLGPVEPWKGPGLEDATQAAADVLTAADFLGALNYLAKSKKNFNAEEVADTLQQALPLLPQLTPEQLVQSLKDIDAAGIQPSAAFLTAVLNLLQPRLAEVGLVGLGHLSWAVANLLPCLEAMDTDGGSQTATAEGATGGGGGGGPLTGQGDGTATQQEVWQQQMQLRQLQLLPALWVEDLLAASLQLMREQQQGHQQQQQQQQNQQQHVKEQQHALQQQQQGRPLRLPIQPLVHLLLLPATVGLVPSPAWCGSYFQLLEVGFKRASCQDVAQLVACLTWLDVRPPPGIRQLLMEHFEEDHLLYDADQLAKLVEGLEVLGVASADSVWVQLLVKRLGVAAQGCTDEDALVILQQLAARARDALAVKATVKG